MNCLHAWDMWGRVDIWIIPEFGVQRGIRNLSEWPANSISQITRKVMWHLEVKIYFLWINVQIMERRINFKSRITPGWHYSVSLRGNLKSLQRREAKKCQQYLMLTINEVTKRSHKQEADWKSYLSLWSWSYYQFSSSKLLPCTC